VSLSSFTRSIALKLPAVLRDGIVKNFINIPACFGDYGNYAELEYGSKSYWSAYMQSTLEAILAHQATSDFQILPRNLACYTALSLAASDAEEGIRVLDIGGGAGYEFFSVASIFRNVPVSQWIVIEQTELAGHIQSNFEHPILRYQADLNNIASKIDLVILSGSLQYLPNPMKTLEEALALNPSHVVISRTPYWDKSSRLTKQLGWKHINGPDGKRLAYPFWVLAEREVARLFSSSYRKVLDCHDGQLMYVSKHGFLPYRSLIFQRISDA